MDSCNEDFLHGVEVRDWELLIATCDSSDGGIDQAVTEVLHLINDKVGMDIVFVSHLQQTGRSLGAALEVLCGERLVRARWVSAPAFPQDAQGNPRQGALIHAPVLLDDGLLYGTMCCFSPGKDAWGTARDQTRLRHTAALAATRVCANRKPLVLIAPM